jgi:hypothetical protein
MPTLAERLLALPYRVKALCTAFCTTAFIGIASGIAQWWAA